MTRKVLFVLGLLSILIAPSAHAEDLGDAVARRRAERLATQRGETITTEQPTVTLRPRRAEEDTTISDIFNRANLQTTGRPSLRELRRNARLQVQESEDRGFRGRTPASLPSGETSELKEKVFALTNVERTNEGLNAYTYNATLEKSAQAYAQELWDKGYFAHIALDGSTPKERIEEAGYGTVNQANCGCRGYKVYFGENLAKGQATPEQAVRDWMNSPSHRDAILHDHFTEIGIGVVGNVWVQNFGAIELQY